MTDTEAQEAALRGSLAPLRAIAADSQRMPEADAGVHAHEWASEPVEDARLFRWKCTDPECGEAVAMDWRPEWAGLGLGDIGRLMVCERGGRLAEDTRTVEQRLAAIEEMFAHPLRVIEAPPADFTPEQEARLRESLDALGSGGKPFEYEILPPAPLLTPELARELLRECVTVVKPGETLIVRVDRTWTPAQVKDVQEYADTVTGYRELGVTVLFLPGEEFAVAAAKPEECE